MMCIQLRNLVLVISLLGLLFGCDYSAPRNVEKKELLIYCGATMPQPMRELADLFEQQENCIVKIIKGGSGTLYRSIQINQAGDLYLPGSESYIEKGLSDGVVVETRPVGWNRAALIVAKGNPLNISADLKNLADARYRTVLGSPDSGSIGRETKRILTGAGLYEAAIDHALYLTSDSKGLRQAISDGGADLTLNWYATAVWVENRESMDVLRLSNELAPPHTLVLALLRYSQHPELARRFIALAASKTGRGIFEHYGFGD